MAIREGFEIGEVLYGFCNGYFGRDSYENKRVEAVGIDWIVCRDEEGNVHFATFDRNKPNFWVMVNDWRTPE